MQFDLIENAPEGVRIRWVKEDGGYHREVRAPDADFADLPSEAREAVSKHWTPERLADYQQWLEDAQGGEQPSSPDALLAAFEAAIQAHLDARARERGYDGIQTAVTYRDDPNPVYAAEGAALFAHRSAVWTYATAELEKVRDGIRTVPTVSAFIDELPAFSWPTAAP